MKLLIFSCLVALALARPEALNFSARRVKHQEAESRLNEVIIPARAVSSSEETSQEAIEIRYPLEQQVLDKAREERVRRPVEYIIEDDSSALNERKIEDARAYDEQYLRRPEEERAVHYRELRAFPTEARKLKAYREPYVQPEIYYYLISVPQPMPYPDEVPLAYTYKFVVPAVNRADEAVNTPVEEEKN
ncbi:alpha-S1-casein [Monodelphis domestica]|uniref:alpha-S1-casein n=1 Tax=Monodelphis domestica TaxID=13616 RepID=UPI0004430F9F|nr:alpha-S1-casein [Monodelphis domestica]